MILLEGFYGQTVEIEEDRLYDGAEEIWLQRRDGVVRLGVTKVGVLLMGGVESTELFVEPGDSVEVDSEIAFFETFKAVRYIVSPLTGTVTAVNENVVDDPELFDDDPYGGAWLIELEPRAGQDLDSLFSDPRSYVEALERSEHCAEGAEELLEVKKGSPTCRAVYGGIRGNEPGEGSLGRDPAETQDETGPAAGTTSPGEGAQRTTEAEDE
jgi:glycine cleavage system H protein